MPRLPVANRPMAEVSPDTCRCAAAMMVPAARKPMPEPTWAEKRDMSNFMPTASTAKVHGPLSISYSYRLTSIVSAAPMLVSM